MFQPYDIAIDNCGVHDSPAHRTLQTILTSHVSIVQFLQDTTGKQRTRFHHGIARTIHGYRLTDHVRDCQQPPVSGRAVYMCNCPLDRVIALREIADLVSSIPQLSDDVCHLYSDIYDHGPTDDPSFSGSTVSSDLLVGGPGSFTNGHQDRPLWCSSDILMLEGKKIVVVTPGDEGRRLLEPRDCTHEVMTSPNFLQQVKAAGGYIVTLNKGQGVRIPESAWHAVVNLEFTVRWVTKGIPVKGDICSVCIVMSSLCMIVVSYLIMPVSWCAVWSHAYHISQLRDFALEFDMAICTLCCSQPQPQLLQLQRHSQSYLPFWA